MKCKFDKKGKIGQNGQKGCIGQISQNGQKAEMAKKAYWPKQPDGIILLELQKGQKGQNA